MNKNYKKKNISTLETFSNFKDISEKFPKQNERNNNFIINNLLNNARATVDGLCSLRSYNN